VGKGGRGRAVAPPIWDLGGTPPRTARRMSAAAAALLSASHRSPLALTLALGPSPTGRVRRRHGLLPSRLPLDMLEARHVNPKISPARQCLWTEFYRSRGACLAATGGCPYPTEWLGHPDRLQLVTSVSAQETTSSICLCPRRGGPAACARRGAEVLPATPAPPRTPRSKTPP
jgi:hypothetical protein